MPIGGYGDAGSITSTAIASGTLWNGGVCGICAARYLGTHTCAPADLLRRATELIEMAGRIPSTPADRTSGCPCRPENGGSGVCGCIMGSQITC